MPEGPVPEEPPFGVAAPAPAPVSGPAEGDGLFAMAAAVGGYRWLEHRLFEVTGRWSCEPGWPELAVHLSEMSLQHAWHAELWADRLPLLAVVDQEALTRPPSPALAACTDLLVGAADARQCLAGLTRVLVPRALVAYERHRRAAALNVAALRPLSRALDLVVRDELAEWLSGEQLLQSVLTSSSDVEEAGAFQTRLERLLAGVSGAAEAVHSSAPEGRGAPNSGVAPNGATADPGLGGPAHSPDT